MQTYQSVIKSIAVDSSEQYVYFALATSTSVIQLHASDGSLSYSFTM